MSDDLFLTDEQIARLTGWRMKSRQIAWLRAEGVPFRVNATGHPVVTRAAAEGRKQEQEAAASKATAWSPRVIQRSA